MGVTYYSGSGDDVEAIYSQVGNIISEVRNNVPSLVHLDTFRRYEHCGPNLDDSMGYRKSEEINSYISRDPLEILKNKIIDSGLISETLLKRLVNQIDYFTEEIFMNMIKQNKDYLAQFEMN
jgi:TPP-dependent pyruvate/acetoin dehydrogenase alpha subunit